MYLQTREIGNDTASCITRGGGYGSHPCAWSINDLCTASIYCTVLMGNFVEYSSLDNMEIATISELITLLIFGVSVESDLFPA